MTELGDERLRTRTGEFSFDRENRIVRFDVDEGAVQTLDDAKENIAANKRFNKGTPYPVLCDLTRCKGTDLDARNYYASDEATQAYRAMALLGGRPVGRMIGNIFLAVYGNRAKPIRLFADEREAIQWLKGFAG
ncbi:hypothetical protein WMF04_04535 [Sorangium sp. So ce260]|uniref:DUF7793 family protein n=1 Tax=Sorangium sp. So ce260 TaxID=3133291 RepID=UPI003F5F90CB